MSINKELEKLEDLEETPVPDDFFDDDFEVIYEGDLPNPPTGYTDDFHDVLSRLSDLDKTGTNVNYLKANDCDSPSPVAKTAKTGGKAHWKSVIKALWKSWTGRT